MPLYSLWEGHYQKAIRVDEDAVKLEPLPTIAGNLNGAPTLEKNLAVPLKVKHRVTIWTSYSTPRYMPKGDKNICSLKNSYMNVHSSIVHDGQTSGNNPNVHQQYIT